MDNPRTPLKERLDAAPAPRERAAFLRMRLSGLFDALRQMSGNRDFERMQEEMEDSLGDCRFCDAVAMALDMEPPYREDFLYRLLAEPFGMFWTYEDAAGDSARR